MNKVKLSGNHYYNASNIKHVNNKPIFHNGQVFMFSQVKIITEEEIYGRKNDKKRTAHYITCKVYVYNHIGEWLGVASDAWLDKFIRWFNLDITIPKARQDYLKLETSINAIKAKLEEITTPDIVKAEPN